MGDLAFQVHHIIPINVFNAFEGDFQRIFQTKDLEKIIQSYNNRMALFTEEGSANALRNLHREGGLKDAPLGSAQHYTSHPKYDNAIRRVISSIVSSKLTDPQKRTMLIDMQYSLREMLQSGQPSIYADEAIISDAVKRGMASVDEIRSGKGDNYTRALEREARYDKNNEKYPDLMNDSVGKNAKEEFASDGTNNDNFVKKTGHEIAKALLDANKKTPFLDGTNGKESAKKALEEVVSGVRKDNNYIRDAIAQGVFEYKKEFPYVDNKLGGEFGENHNPDNGNSDSTPPKTGGNNGKDSSGVDTPSDKTSPHPINDIGTPNHGNNTVATHPPTATEAARAINDANTLTIEAERAEQRARNIEGTFRMAQNDSALSNDYKQQLGEKARQMRGYANEANARAAEARTNAEASRTAFTEHTRATGSKADLPEIHKPVAPDNTSAAQRKFDAAMARVEKNGGFSRMFGEISQHISRNSLFGSNILVPHGNGFKVNPAITQGQYGRFVRGYFTNNVLGGKVGVGGMVAGYFDATFDAIVHGAETGDWEPFYDISSRYGEKLATTIPAMVLATEGLGVVTTMMGVPILGEIAMAGLMLWGAFEIGWSIGSLIRKGWNWLTGNHEDWDRLNRDGTYQLIGYEPLVLDLDGDGIETVASNGHDGALFDHDKDGIRTATGWVGKDDGLLVYDRNGDGTVNNGGELFGDNTLLKNGERATSGYQALADLDDNGDGKVDAADSAFAHLRVWRDLNQDGISQEGELLTLDEAKVKALNLIYRKGNYNFGNGNTLIEEGTYIDSDGNKRKMGDLIFAADHFHSRFSDSVTLTDEQQQAPNLRGSGRVRDLREAAVQSPDVAAVLQAYANAETKEEQLALRDQLLRAWAGTDKRFTTEGDIKVAKTMSNSGKNPVRLTVDEAQKLGMLKGGPDIWTLLGIEDPEKKKKAALREKIAILDAFTGTFSPNLYYGSKQQAQHIIDTVEKTYANLADNLYDGLLFQTRLKPYLNAIRFGMDDAGKLRLDYSGVAALFDEVHAKNPGKAFTDLGELLAKGNADGKNADMAPLAEKFVQYVQEASSNGTFGAYSKVLGKKAFSALGHFCGTEKGDYLYSDDNTNYIYGNDGDDQIYANGGDDIVDGGAGNDFIAGGKGNDQLSGGAGDDKVYGGEGNDRIDGGNGNDALYGSEGNDELHGGQGDDHVSGGEGDDLLNGNAGNDSLNGDYGHDILDGGAGNDTLRGGENGRDTYIFQIGHGQDTVIDMATIDTNGDILRFEGAESADAYFNREGIDLLVRAYGSNDHVRIKDYFSSEHSQRYTFQFDNISLQRYDIAQKSFDFSGSDKDDRIGAWVTDDTIHGLGGNDNIVGNAGNDKLFGDEGDDYLAGNDGNDELDGGEGNDSLSGDAGDDKLHGGAGDDKLKGGAGKDVIDGGAGNDTLHGDDAGWFHDSDTYIFQAGHGRDTVVDMAITDKDGDTLRFEGAKSADAYFNREGVDLLVSAYGSNNDQVRISNYFYTEHYRHYSFQFDDQQLNSADIAKKEFEFSGSDKDDRIGAWVTGDTIHGLGGNDNIVGNVGNDKLFGDQGDDYLAGREGNDELDGGSGNDTLNGESGFDFLRKVHERKPEIRTILITSSSRDSDFREAKALGVDAYLLKDAFIDEIVFCLKSVERGGKFYSAALVDPRLSEEEKKLGTLTEREREVYQLMCQGYTNLEISARLFITEGTAKRHVSNILSKLGSKNRVEAVIQSGQKGYLTEKNRGKRPGPQPKGEER